MFVLRCEHLIAHTQRCKSIRVEFPRWHLRQKSCWWWRRMSAPASTGASAVGYWPCCWPAGRSTRARTDPWLFLQSPAAGAPLSGTGQSRPTGSRCRSKVTQAPCRLSRTLKTNFRVHFQYYNFFTRTAVYSAPLTFQSPLVQIPSSILSQPWVFSTLPRRIQGRVEWNHGRDEILQFFWLPLTCVEIIFWTYQIICEKAVW